MILSDSQMLKTGYLAQTSHLYWRLFQNSQVSLNPHNISHVGFMSMPTFSKFQNMITRHKYSGYSCYSTMASESEASVVNSCTANTNKSSCPRRSYQVVVAATRDMGIGRDGKLPWNLPSDLKFFKEVTTSTSVAGKRNAVIMGRRTWESIPLKYRPLPGRLNVVLTRSGKLEGTTLEDLLVCCDLSSALKLLAKPSYSLSVEKVFIIGGGQVLKECTWL